jgi:hypothetical protein
VTAIHRRVNIFQSSVKSKNHAVRDCLRKNCFLDGYKILNKLFYFYILAVMSSYQKCIGV